MLTLCVALAITQTQDSPMRQLSFLEGTWEGPGWFVSGPNARHTIKQYETVKYEANGHVLVIRGIGKEMVDNKEKVVHDAYAIVFYDPAQKGFRMRSFLSDGRTLETELKVGDKSFEWGREIPNGKVRYRMSLNDKGQWVETGEYTMDGNRWLKNIEFTLDKKKG